MTAEDALAQLLRHLKAAHYEFIAITPATHARVLARPVSRRASLRDIFGWNRRFDEGDLSPGLLRLLAAAGALDDRGGQLRSKVRVASLGDDLFLHSHFPTDDAASVFFGPDTYRFARFIKAQLPRLAAAPTSLVDMGAGSGAGAIVAAKRLRFETITMVDVNPEALRLASINAAVARVSAQTLISDSVPAGADLIIANPPYMMDLANRVYRNGGGLLGGEIALDWVEQALGRLESSGTMLLYTGAAFVEGKAPLIDGLAEACADHGASLEVHELDPDVFGEELDQEPYDHVDRIAAIGAIIHAAGPSRHAR